MEYYIENLCIISINLTHCVISNTRLTGILTLSLTSDSGPINKLLNEIYKPILDFVTQCLDIQNWYSRFPIPKVPMGFLIPWRNTCQPPSQTPGDSDNFGPGNKKTRPEVRAGKLNNMQQQHNTPRVVT